MTRPAALVLVLAACSTEPRPAEAPVPPGPLLSASERGDGLADAHARAQASFAPVPQWIGEPGRTELVELGRTLYHDPRLSDSGEQSCASCHPLDRYGASTGGRRDALSVYNAGMQKALYWDGRAQSLEEQVRLSLLEDDELGNPDEAAAARSISRAKGYAPLFIAAFGDSRITADRIGKAIAAFERGLVTPSPFDAYVAGDPEALTPDEVRGLQKFMDHGCITCHVGPTIGGQFFRLGMIEPYETEDQGRFEVTGSEIDRKAFKVPSLRNVAETGPYLHDGSIKTLPQMVKLMGRHQLGKDLPDDDVEDIITFLRSLTGRIPVSYARPPAEMP